MKYIKLFFLLFLFTNIAYSQEKNYDKKHDISFGFINLTDNFELAYDYLLDTNSSIGASISYSLKNKLFSKDLSYDNEFSIKFNYKYYLSKKNKGVYFKPEITYYNGTSYRYDYQKREYVENDSYPYESLYLGLNVGYKYIFKNNFFIDSNIGLSTKIINLNSKHNTISNKQNFSFSIGKRF